MESREFSSVFWCFGVLLFCGWVGGGYYYHQSALLANELASIQKNRGESIATEHFRIIQLTHRKRNQTINPNLLLFST